MTAWTPREEANARAEMVRFSKRLLSRLWERHPRILQTLGAKRD